MSQPEQDLVTEALLDALRLIAGPCEIYTGGVRCSDENKVGRNRSREAFHLADRWCFPCVALDALVHYGQRRGRS